MKAKPNSLRFEQIGLLAVDLYLPIGCDNFNDAAYLNLSK